ncbi:MAG: hypothetical protein ACYDDF_02970 [Thermoplasmatota archaeon]
MNSRWIGFGVLGATLLLGGAALAATTGAQNQTTSSNPLGQWLGTSSGPSGWGGLGHGHRGHPFGGAVGALSGFTQANGSVSGLYVSFAPNSTSGSLKNVVDHTANGTITLFDSVTVAAGASPVTGSIRGSGYVLSASGVRILIADAPGAPVVGVSTVDSNVTFDLPAGANVTVHPKVPHWSPAGATLTIGSLRENLVVSGGGSVTLNGTALTVHLTPGSGFRLGGLGGFAGPTRGPCPRGFGGGFGRARAAPSRGLGWRR